MQSNLQLILDLFFLVTNSLAFSFYKLFVPGKHFKSSVIFSVKTVALDLLRALLETSDSA